MGSLSANKSISNEHTKILNVVRQSCFLSAVMND
jgi:hypothetical protein